MPENHEHKHVGEAIKARRLALGLTQPELCRRLGWEEQSISAISQIETRLPGKPDCRELEGLR